MKNWKRTTAGSAVGIIAVVLLSFAWISWDMPWEKASAGVVNSSGVFTIPSNTGTLGTNTNPFVVLEIVPNENMAQFGYLVDGQEPIDLFAAMTHEANNTIVTDALSNYMTVTLVDSDVMKQEFITAITNQEWVNYYWNYYVNANQYGYYEKLTDNNGDYNITVNLKTIKDPVTLIDKIIYEYSLLSVQEGTGSYNWVGYPYEESKNVTDTTKYKNVVLSDSQLNASAEGLQKIYGFKENAQVYSAYEGKKINNELFKKYALGLAYKDIDFAKGEDSAAYEFIGWYREPECVNPFNESEKITSDITLYAKWKTKYSDATSPLYTINFDVNAGAEEVLHVPDKIEYLNKDDFTKEPDNIPLRKGYVFTGWYKEVDCTTKYDFTKAVTASTTLYAGWKALPEKTYTIRFNSNAGIGNDAMVTNLPAAVANVRRNGRTSDFTVVEPVTVPNRTGYLFAGWYWNTTCTNPFHFDASIPDEVMTDNIDLYARWVSSSSSVSYKVTFSGNRPKNAVSTVQGLPKSITSLTYNASLQGIFPADTPSLQGNITQKLKNYQVKVITLTPRDLKDQTANLALIDRANLIIMNETCENQLKTFWSRYRNKELFSKDDAKYDITATKFTGNDLTWATTLRLLNKLTGVNSTVMCPVIYDYNIYQSVIESTDATVKKSIGFSSIFSDSTTFTISNVNGYSSNVYKLYLMTQQLNPITLYNAYLKDAASAKLDTLGNFLGGASWSSDAKRYWNKYTLLPYDVIPSSDWDITATDFRSNALEVIGFDRDYTVSAGQGSINNRVFLYQGSSSVVDGFMSPQLPSVGAEELNRYFYPGRADLPERYTTADGIYYMLHNSELYKNFSKNLNIMEIEPSDSFKKSNFWFWYISRYVPNFTGIFNVTMKNSSEFIGDIDNLNSKYDVIYLGADISSLVTDLMPNSVTNKTAAKNEVITIQTAQTMSSNYQLRTLTPQVITTYETSATPQTGYATVAGSNKAVIAFNQGVPYVIYSNIGTDKSWLNLQVYYKTTSNVNNAVYSYKNGSNTIYFSDLYVYSSAYPQISSKFQVTNSGEFRNVKNSNSRGAIVLNDYYLKTINTTIYTETWVNRNSGTNVVKGDAIRFTSNSGGTYKIGGPYAYAHVGVEVTGKNTRRGSFNNVTDTIDQYLYSGNDLSRAKLNHLLEFAKAGYPIILSREIFDSSGDINTYSIDKASNIYNLIQKLTTDIQYTPSCFLEQDTLRDDEFIDALNNKNFKLVVLEKPVEYVDKTNTAYQSKTEDKIYINGAEDGSDRNIDEKNLDFTIKIDTANTGYYEVRLYIDTNADGKFSETEEKLDSLEIENTLTLKTVRVNRLQGGQTYHLVRQIKDYVGAIPWKLEIVDGNNPLIRDEIIGQCAIKVTAKTKLKVLQIISDGISSSSYMPTVYFPTTEDIDRAKSLNGNKDITDIGVNKDTYFTNTIKLVNSNTYIKPESADNEETRTTKKNIIANAGWFYYYTKILKEFEVEFYRLSVTQFSTLASTGVIAGDSTNYLKNGKCTYLKDKGINMLILGYADCYSDITNTKALQLIDNFISAGNTTLFTHDTTSFVNLSSKPGTFSDVYWGYNINQYFRKLLGMDRFGVMDNKGVIANLTNAADKPYKVNTLQSANSFYTATGTNVGTRALTQGMSNVTVGQDGARVTSATKANDGQIVTYPYLIPDNLTVASTHSQYYQLDMEADDIVVWYCLDGTNNFYKTDNDVRNNYYIYNRGNITYSGVGHSGGLSDNERMLFVNTMIAAYSAGTVPSEPVITNKDKSSEDNMTDYLYVDYDASLSVDEAMPFGAEIYSYMNGTDTIYTKRIYFTLKNYSIIMNKKMTMHYYPVITTTTPTGTVKKVLTEYPLILATHDYDSETNVGTVVANDTFPYKQTFSDGTQSLINLTGGLVESTYEYYVDVPISDNYYKNLITGNSDQLENFALNSNSKFEVQFQVIMRYGKEEAENEPLVGIRNAVFMKRGMFTLD